MGTITLCEDSDSDDEDAKKVVDSKGTIRQVAKVLPYEANISESSEDGVIDSEMNYENNEDVQEIEEIAETDPFAGVEQAETDVVQPSTSGLGLRLRNFAIDPAANITTSSNDSSSSNNRQFTSGNNSFWKWQIIDYNIFTCFLFRSVVIIGSDNHHCTMVDK